MWKIAKTLWKVQLFYSPRTGSITMFTMIVKKHTFNSISHMQKVLKGKLNDSVE
jgi:hypothetical protein